jgi:hypothetical protein
MLRHAFPSAFSLGPAREKANLRIITLHDQRRALDFQRLAAKGDASQIIGDEAK